MGNRSLAAIAILTVFTVRTVFFTANRANRDRIVASRSGKRSGTAADSKQPNPQKKNDEAPQKDPLSVFEPYEAVAPLTTVIPEEDIAFCKAPGRNLVWPRVDNQLVRFEIERPLSITNDTYASFHSRPVANSDELSYAVKFGKRQWRDPLHINSEQHVSYFLPAKYDIPSLSSSESCSILSQYSHILMLGDSLSRHVRQAIFILLRNNFVSGAIISSNKHGAINPYDTCRCDGQFSETNKCRQNNGFFNDCTPRDLDLCRYLNDTEQFQFTYQFKTINVPPKTWELANCTDPQSRGVLIYFQGGIHYSSDVNSTIQQLIEPVTNQTGFKDCLKYGKVHVIWSTYTAQSRTLDKRYPKQSRESALIFNDGMEEYWAEQSFPVITLDWWNLTADSQTADGFHSLADVNLMKATQLLHAMNYSRHSLE